MKIRSLARLFIIIRKNISYFNCNLFIIIIIISSSRSSSSIMATVGDIGVSAAFNILFTFLFFFAFAILRLQPVNDRVYFPKWYLRGIRCLPTNNHARPNLVTNFLNLDLSTYLKFLDWMPAAIKMPQLELIDHAGLDSAVYVRIYLLGLKIFVPICAVAFCILIPVNWTGKALRKQKYLIFSQIDELSISNISPGSDRLWAHLAMAYVFTFWTFYMLYEEYKIIASMRMSFLASQSRRPDQFTVIVRNIPADPDESISEHIEHFFYVNHPDHYLSHQVVYNANYLAKLVDKKKSLHNWLVYYKNKHENNPAVRPKMKTGFLGFWGKQVDAIEYYTSAIDELTRKEITERDRVTSDRKSIMPVAFVSFKSRWGAAVCAQTQQSSNPTLWLTEWAPEPRDVYWTNLAIPFVELTIRRLGVAVAIFFLTFFFMIPIAFVQSLANLEGIEKVLPFLKPIIEMKVVKSFIQGLLPGIALKIFLILLPMILMTMSKIEGFTSLSTLERRSAAKYYLFLLVNVFLGSIVTGTAFEQLHSFINDSAAKIPVTVGESIPMKATFFITYIMVDGWAGVSAEIIRLKPLVVYHLKNTFLVKTEQDREEAMDPGSLTFASSEPRIQLYFLLGLVYSVVTPILLPFIIIFFALSYTVFRHQVINVYNQEYESGGAFWPDVHERLIAAMIISQVLLMGLMSTKQAVQSTPFIFILIISTIWFHLFCKSRFASTFMRFPLQEATVKDTLDRATEPNFNLKLYLQSAYVHPVFRNENIDNPKVIDEEETNHLVPTKRVSRKNTPADSTTTSDGEREEDF